MDIWNVAYLGFYPLYLANFTAAGITMDGYILPGEWEMKVSVVYESRNKFYQHLIVRL